MPVIRPAPGSSSPYTPCAARAESSRNGEPRIEQRRDALARQQLAGLGVLVACRRAAARGIALQRRAQVVDQ